jgi:electron transport complex protein RnfG
MNDLVRYALVLGLIATISAGVLAATNAVTAEPIKEAYRQDFLKGLVAVLPEFDNSPDTEVLDIQGYTVYVAKKGGETVGYAVQTSSMRGYSGEIGVLVGADNAGKISGVTVLKHAETPGLGDKITGAAWLQSFVGGALGDTYAVKKDGGDIDSFSGATISPRAVSEAVTSAGKILVEAK